MHTLISLAEYARHRGVSRSAVSKAARVGRISLIDGKVDREVADIQWERRTDFHQSQRASRRRSAQIAAAGPSAPGGAAAYLGDESSPRARREAAQADLAELELAERRGELVSAQAVEQALATKILSVRESLDTLADRITPLLAAETDPVKVYALLRTEIRQVLEQLASASRAGSGA
jgi:hypothetical protein